MTQGAIYCVACATRIAVPASNSSQKPRQYCSNACRQRAYRERKGARPSVPFALGRGGPGGLTGLGGKADTLPVRLDRFVGRDRELQQMASYGEVPVLTVTGPPGAGKSRLALRFAELNRHDLAPHWLDIDKVPDGRSLRGALADVLRVPDRSDGDGCDGIVSTLQRHRQLLVLDNVEQRVDECARLVEGLAAAFPQVRILVTSRETLRIPGEAVFHVGPLSLPTAEHAAEPRTVLRSDAVQLFVTRATFYHPSFAISADNAAAVSELCTELDGLPLAIELAARRIGIFTVADLLERVRGEDDVLTLANRTASNRHCGLHASIDASYRGLKPDERAAFRRLSVLPGRFILDLATAVCVDEHTSANDAVALVSALHDKSLLMSDLSDGVMTFYQHRSLRRFAAAELYGTREVDETYERSVAWFAEQLRPATMAISPPPGLLLTLSRSQDQMLAAAQWAHRQADPRLTLLVCGLLRCTRNALDPRMTDLIHAAIQMPAAADLDRVCLLTELASSLRESGRAAVAGEYAVAATNLGRALHAAAPVVVAQLELARCRLAVGNPLGATSSTMAAMSVARTAEPDAGMALCLESLAAVRLSAGELDAANKLIIPALATAGADDWASVRVLCTAASIALARDDDVSATAIIAEAVRRSITDGDIGYPALRRLTALRAGADPAPLGDPAADPLAGGTQEENKPRTAAACRSAPAGQAGAWSPPSGPSERQRLIAELVADGLTNGQIASRLGVSSRTVAAQLTQLRAVLRLQSRTEVAAWARSMRYGG